MIHPGKLTWNPTIPPLEKEVSTNPSLQTTNYGVQNVSFVYQPLALLGADRGITPLAPHFGSDRQGVVRTSDPWDFDLFMMILN